jgi:hypothetical protein
LQIPFTTGYLQSRKHFSTFKQFWVVIIKQWQNIAF